MQYLTHNPGLTTRDVLEFNPVGLNGTTGSISEDCLSIKHFGAASPTRTSDEAPSPCLLPRRRFPGTRVAAPTFPRYQITTQWVQRTQYAIEDFLHRHSDAELAPRVYFAPVIDERTVHSNYTARAHAGQIARLPTLVGTSRDEGVCFAKPHNPARVVVDSIAAEERRHVRLSIARRSKRRGHG